MNNKRIKYKLIYGRYLVLMLGLLLFYSLLHWILVLKLQWLSPSLFISHWAGPIVLSVPAVCFLLYNRINLLDLPNKKGNDYGSYTMMAIIFTLGPVVSFQFLLVDITGELKVLNRPEEIVQHKPARYYSVRNHQVDKANARWKHFQRRVGKGQVRMAHEMILAVPLYAPERLPQVPGDSAPAAIWLVKQYQTEVSINESPYYQDSVIRAFVQNAKERFRIDHTDGFSFLQRPAVDDDLGKYIATAGLAADTHHNTVHLLLPVYEPYHSRYQQSLFWAFAILLLCCGLWAWMLAGPGINRTAWQEYEAQLAGRSGRASFYRGSDRER